MTHSLAPAPHKNSLALLLSREPEVREVMVCSADGRLEAAPSEMDRETAERMCLFGAALLSTADDPHGTLGIGSVKCSVTRLRDGWMLVLPLKDEGRAVLLVDAHLDLTQARAALHQARAIVSGQVSGE